MSRTRDIIFEVLAHAFSITSGFKDEAKAVDFEKFVDAAIDQAKNTRYRSLSPDDIIEFTLNSIPLRLNYATLVAGLNRPSLLKRMIDFKADINPGRSQMPNALYIACYKDCGETAKFLVENYKMDVHATCLGMT